MAQVGGGLPPGWEQGQMPDGRTYYVNHATKETTWTVRGDYCVHSNTKPTASRVSVLRQCVCFAESLI